MYTLADSIQDFQLKKDALKVIMGKWADSIQEFQLKKDALKVIMGKWETVVQRIFDERRDCIDHPELME